MPRNGTRPAQHIHRVKKYRHFGSIAPIPDFDLGATLPLQDQEKDKADYECTGYSAGHILSSIFGQTFSPDFSYAAARYVAGDGKEGTPGTSFHAGMDSIVAVGGLPESLAIISAEKNSEAYVSDWGNWLQSLKNAALTQVQNGVRNVLGFGDSYDAVLSALSQGKIPVSVGSPWFDQWRTNVQGGVVQMPVLNGQYQSWHNYTIDGKTTINGVPYLIVYSHQGNRVGDGGKLYFSREVVNATLSVEGSGALAIDPHSIRWVSLIGLIIRRFPALTPQLIQLLHL